MEELSATATLLITIGANMVAVSITAFVTWRIAAKRIFIENVTRERKRWREKVRERVLLVHDAMIKRNREDLDRYRNAFRVLLNPQDCEDRGIIRSIKLPQDGGELEQAEEFSERIALLLKHDWERAKREAKHFSFLRCKPKRKSYCI